MEIRIWENHKFPQLCLFNPWEVRILFVFLYEGCVGDCACIYEYVHLRGMSVLMTLGYFGLSKTEKQREGLRIEL